MTVLTDDVTATGIAPERPPTPGRPAGVAPFERPRMRGVLHRYSAPALGGAFAVLAILAGDGAATAWVAVYGVCVTAMLTVSAIYHSGKLSPRALIVFKRIDHAMILMAIAGSYTGMVGLTLGGSTRTVLLVAVWALAAIGVAIRMLWINAPYPLTAAVYVAVGWAALFDIGAFVGAFTGAQLALIATGGLLYTLGAVVYALHRPNPWPKTFAYHEVFHTMVVVAAVAHFAAAASIVTAR